MIRNIQFLILAIVLAGCSTSKSLDVVEAPAEFVCRLSNNIEDIGSLESISVFDDGFAVIANPSKVMLYGFDGKQKCEIGHPGKARLEYNMPYIIRSCNDSLYIWSANSMKFISYSKEGRAVAEYSYKSAIRDFLPTDNEIVVYTKGLRSENVIDIYSKSESSVIISHGVSSEEHKVLLSRTAVAPLSYNNDCISYTQKGDMSVTSYNVRTCEDVSKLGISSETFSCADVEDAEAFLKDRRKRGEYLMNSSMSLAIIPNGKGDLLLTLEGYEQDAGNRTIDYSNRYFGLYNIKKGKPQAFYSYNSIGSPYLMSVYDGVLYFIRRKDIENNDEVYELYRLRLK